MNRPSLLRILVAAIVAIAASVAAILSTPSDTTVPIQNQQVRRRAINQAKALELLYKI